MPAPLALVSTGIVARGEVVWCCEVVNSLMAALMSES